MHLPAALSIIPIPQARPHYIASIARNTPTLLSRVLLRPYQTNLKSSRYCVSFARSTQTHTRDISTEASVHNAALEKPQINPRHSTPALVPPALRSQFQDPFAATRARSMSADMGQKKHKVTVVGSGNWGSAIAKIVAENAAEYPDLFEKDVQMWVYEEEVTIPKSSKHYDPGSELSLKPQKLTSIINRIHENVKYLPGVDLPTNLIANPSLEDSVQDSSLLIFNLPHQFISRICDQMKGKVMPFARGISCIKGVDVSSEGIKLFSDSIADKLGIYCGALSGANIASEVALEKFSETTIAYDPPPMDSRQGTPNPPGAGNKVKLQPMPAEYPPLTQATIRKLFHRPYFHVRLVQDVAGVSLGGALKNVVALAAGFVDGLGWGDNAKAAVMRVGILEQARFGEMFFPSSFEPRTMTEESCGIADMITSCSGGRNFRCAKMSVKEGLSIQEVEKRELNGQILQGVGTAAEVYGFLKQQGKDREFPLLVAVQDILEGRVKAEQIPDLIEAKH